MRNPIYLLFGALAFCIVLSCTTTECKNSNPIFDQTTPEMKQYQEELARLLEAKQTAGLAFTLDRYEEKDGIPYLYLSVRGQNLCATAIMLVLNPDKKMAQVQKVKGESYAGAEFKGLKYKIFRDESKTVLLYEGVGSISD